MEKVLEYIRKTAYKTALCLDNAQANKNDPEQQKKDIQQAGEFADFVYHSLIGFQAAMESEVTDG